MNLWELVLVGMALWTAIGVLGTGVALVRGEGDRARRGVAWLAGVWVVYLATVLVTARVQGQRTVPLGQAQCFDEMCFTVRGVDEVEGYFGRNGVADGSRLLRVTVEVRNKGRGRPQSEGLMRAYLTDAQGGRWSEVPGVGGVGLTAMVAAGSTVASEPVFKVPGQARGLGLVLTHGRWQPGVLVIGDSDSLGHRPTVVPLER